MIPCHPLRALSRVLPLLLFALGTPPAALGQPRATGAPPIVPELREQLSQAAVDTLLPRWQRDFMLRLARTGAVATLDSPVAAPDVAPPAVASGVADGAWTAPAIRPSARGYHSAIYDPVRDRMVVFGGDDNSTPHFFGDVWALSLAGVPAWTLLTPTGTPPSNRSAHSAIYDPIRDRMVIFGGRDSTGPLNEVWALSLAGTPAWTLLTPTGTPSGSRSAHSAIYDAVRDRMVVFGGYRNYAYLNDVWALSLAGTPAWTQLTPTGTPPVTRWGHSAIYDPARDRMVVFGGYVMSGQELNDVWTLSLAGTPAWTLLPPAGTPPSGRCDHSAVYDPVRDRMLVFGGVNPFLNDVWTLSLAGTPAWTQLTPAGALVSARSSHGAVYDPVRDRMVVFAGIGETFSPVDDLWTLSLADTPAWTLQMPPNARSSHTAIHDPVRDRMVVFGGVGTSSPWYLGDVWTLSMAGTPAWTQLTPTGTPPSARGYQSAIYDPVRDRMVVFGGYFYDGADHFLNDVWALSLGGTPAWTQLAPTGTLPSGQSNHTAIYDPVRDRMVIFGAGSSSSFNEVWALSLAEPPAWTQLTPTGTQPSARSAHSAIYDPVRDCMMVFGGYFYDGVGHSLNDVWTLSLADTPAWTQLAPAGTLPGARYYHSATYDPVRDRMVVFGGYSNRSLRNDAWALSLAGPPTWTQLAPTGTPPSARDAHSATYDPLRDRMLVFGGYSDSRVNDLWALEWSFATAVDDPPSQSFVNCLRPPAPNPARGTTTVSFVLAQAGRVQLGVYDVNGRLVRRLVDGERRAGTGTVAWNGTNESGARLGAGVYFVRLAGPGLRETRRVVLLE